MTKHHQPTFSGRLELAPEREQIDRLVREVIEALSSLGYTESSRFAVRLALEEAISNAFRHGHKGLPEPTPVSLQWSASEDELHVVIRDRGPGFNPGDVPDPTLNENLEMPSGRGIMLMRAYMTSVSFNPLGNEVTMTYRRPPARK